MPSYLHGWCNECVRKGGCGLNCKTTCNTAGPAGCAEQCIAWTQEYQRRFSTDVDGNIPREMSTPTDQKVSVTVSGVSITSGLDSYTVPTFGCGGFDPPGWCESERCGHYLWARCEVDGFGNPGGGYGCCDYMMPDGYASHGTTSGSGVDHVGFCQCIGGGGSTTDDCDDGELAAYAYPSLLDEWEGGGAADVHATPAMFLAPGLRNYCQDSEYEAGESTTALNSVCLEPEHKLRLYAAMDGEYASSVPEDITGGINDCGEFGVFPAAWAPGVASKIVIRQGALDPSAFAYVSVLYWICYQDLSDMPAICGGGSSTTSANLIRWCPAGWRVTYRKAVSDCGCIPSGTYDYYSSSIRGCATSGVAYDNCRCNHSFAGGWWVDSCGDCLAWWEADCGAASCPEAGDEGCCPDPAGGPWYSVACCMACHWDHGCFGCPGDCVNRPRCGSHDFDDPPTDCAGSGSPRPRSYTCISGCNNTRHAAGAGDLWSGHEADIGCNSTCYDTCTPEDFFGGCVSGIGNICGKVWMDSADYDHTAFTLSGTGTCTVTIS